VNAAGLATVVIPTFNRGADLVRTLAALQRQTVGVPRVIVVDNASTDDTADRVAALLPSWSGRLVYLRKAPEGPAVARNRGLEQATTPYVLFIDSDVELPADWMALALARAEAEPDLAALGGLVLYAFDPQRINAYGGELGAFGLAWDALEGRPLDATLAPAQRVWINCSAMLARSDAVRAVGGFDERFFYGYEDTDLGWRLRLAGHRVTVVPELRVLHHVDAGVGAAHPQITFHASKNRLASLLRNASAATLPWRLAAYLAFSAADLLLRGQRGARLRALAWNLRELPATWRLRRQTQAQRRFSDAQVFAHAGGRWLPPSPLGGRRRRDGGTGPAVALGTVPAAAARRPDDRV
jgi:GT2 family glycosyltransferase